jgi:predicted nucleic acid-binding protein
MGDRLLLDTNILIDYLAVRQPFYPLARKLMILGAVQEVELWLCASQVSDAFYVLSEGTKESLCSVAKEKLRQCRQFIRLCEVTEQDIDTALNSDWDDLEDTSICVCAEKLSADFIITRDAAFKTGRIPAIGPEDYFDYLKHERNLTYEELVPA